MIQTIKKALRAYSLSTVVHKGFSTLMSTHIIVSYQKSGKTWLRMMLGKVLAEVYGREINLDLERMTMWKRNAPKILISHAGSTTKDPKINFQYLFRRKKIILLVRDPRDMIVSIYHSAKNREKSFAGTLSEYIHGQDYGIERIVVFMNSWLEEKRRRERDIIMVRYEDLKKDTIAELQRIVDFLKIPASQEILEKAVAYGSFENMRKMEASGEINDRRMKAIDNTNVDSFKTRKGKVGSYKEEMTAEDIAYVDTLIRDKLSKEFGY